MTDAALVDEALGALLAQHRRAQQDASYRTYDQLLPAEADLCSVESVSVGVLVERRGRLADARMREICSALAIAVDCQA